MYCLDRKDDGKIMFTAKCSSPIKDEKELPNSSISTYVSKGVERVIFDGADHIVHDNEFLGSNITFDCTLSPDSDFFTNCLTYEVVLPAGRVFDKKADILSIQGWYRNPQGDNELKGFVPKTAVRDITPLANFNLPQHFISTTGDFFTPFTVNSEKVYLAWSCFITGYVPDNINANGNIYESHTLPVPNPSKFTANEWSSDGTDIFFSNINNINAILNRNGTQYVLKDLKIPTACFRIPGVSFGSEQNLDITTKATVTIKEHIQFKDQTDIDSPNATSWPSVFHRSETASFIKFKTKPREVKNTIILKFSKDNGTCYTNLKPGTRNFNVGKFVSPTFNAIVNHPQTHHHTEGEKIGFVTRPGTRYIAISYTKDNKVTVEVTTTNANPLSSYLG